jgi:uncharacterized protein (DUF58 family)
MQLFDEATLRKLEQLTLVAEQVRVGVMKGDRRSRKRGSSIEFADYRNYVRGDDLRRLDWNIYARLERPFIKLLEEEEDLAVHILVDASASMDWPAASEYHKLRYALHLAGALGHVALSAGDQLTVSLLTGTGSGVQSWGPIRGNQNSLQFFHFLEAAGAGGVTDIDRSLRQYAVRSARPGLLFLLSDLLSPSGYGDGLTALLARGYEATIIHLLSPDEVEPTLTGDLKLVDVETTAESEITLDPTTLQAYRSRLQAWQQEIAAFCAARGVHYLPVITSLRWDQLVLQTMRAQRLLD